MSMIVQIVLSIIGAVIMLLLAVVGYFLKDVISELRKLQETTIKLNTIIAVVQEQIKAQKDDNSTVERRLNNHSERIDCHERDITKIKVKIDLP